jgi:beta-phosphoglucomutase
MSLKWIHNFDLFLFDFDGLLVNTEEIHFEAYRQMCRKFGFELDWDFRMFCGVAHSDSEALRKTIYAQLPELYKQQPDWSVLYAEKKRIYLQLLKAGRVNFLPGAEELLTALQEAGIKRCVVTNSAEEQIEWIKGGLPLLNSIPVWITREYYDKPKPDSECYRKALEMLAEPGDRIVGFEDSLRGLKALQGVSVKAVLICSNDHPQMKEISGVAHFEGLDRIVNLV